MGPLLVSSTIGRRFALRRNKRCASPLIYSYHKPIARLLRCGEPQPFLAPRRLSR